ncbi:MAG: O-antigen ligase family protein [Desulfobacterales bacterium]|nr:MAG: O-antigen ligase family protein [Desulfobacterales bacterium]
MVQLPLVREAIKRRGAVVMLGSILIGLLLSRFIMISPRAGIMFLSAAILLSITVAIRKIDYLIFAWLVLTSVINLILWNVLPEHYYPFAGRGIFWGILVATIVAWGVDKILTGRQFVPFDNVALKVTILIFILWCILSMFASIDLYNSLKQLSKIVIAFVASYMFYDFFSQDQKNIEKLIRLVFLIIIAISFSVVVMSGYCLVSGRPIYKQITVWFWNPNALGFILFICTPILITNGLHFVSNRAAKFLVVTIMLLALFFSFSRTSWVAVSVSLVVLLWRSRIKISMSLVIVIGLFVTALAFPVVVENVYEYFSGEQYTGRREIWRAAWNIACDYPLLGVGIGNALRVMPQHIETSWLRSQDTHNVYLKNALEMGFVSAFILLAFYVIFLYCSWRIERDLKSDYLKLLTRGSAASLLGLFVHGILENGSLGTAFSAADFGVMFPYVLIALPFAAKRLEEKKG